MTVVPKPCCSGGDTCGPLRSVQLIANTSPSRRQHTSTGATTATVRGCTGAALLDRGFCTGMLADLVRDGLATARLESMRTGKHKIAVARVRITNAGQMALEDAAASE